MRMKDGKPVFLSNHAGGILGGISTGQDIVCRLAVKPTSSILRRVRSVDRFGNEVELRTKGRHDPCVGIRAHAGRRGDGGLRAGRPSAAPSRAVRLSAASWPP